MLFGALKAGSTGMQVATDTPVDIILVIQALIIMFVAAPIIVSTVWRYRPQWRGGEQQLTTSWGGT